MNKIPPYLKKGDTVGLTCPAGYMEAEKAQTCIHTLQSWGYEVMVGKTLGSNSKTYFSGTDEVRRNEFQAMLDDPNIKAILCGRGGYGISRIIDQLDFTTFKKHPKWIIGFSDVTVFLSHLNRQLKVVALHAPMAAAFNDKQADKEYVQSLRKALKGAKANYTCKPHTFNKQGACTAELVGGNLAMIAHLIGSPSMYNVNNKILFIEDIGEYIYNIDRMLIQLKRAGVLSKISGLIIGKFSDTQPTVRPFGQNVYQLIQSHVAAYDYPVCYNFPVSHEKENVALKVGVVHQLKVTTNKVSLREL
jgi:muramoyltetrapeptide carboxypeptidase